MGATKFFVCWRRRSLTVLLVISLCAALLSNADTAEAQDPATPVAAWSLNDGTGSIATDSVGTNNAALINGPVWQPGQVGGALEFDGSDDFAEIDDAALSATIPGQSGGSTTDFTFMAWINPDTLDDRKPILSKQGKSVSGPSRGFMLSAGTSSGAGNLYFEMFSNNSSGSKTALSSDNPLTVGAWQHVAVTYGFTAPGSSTLSLYVDGQLAGSTTAATGPLQSNPQPLEIGRYLWSGSYQRYFDGLLDEVLIFDQQLAAAEVLDYFNGSVPNFDPTAAASATPQSGAAPLLVSFDGSGSTDSDGSIVSYDWDFGDGTIGSGITVDHSYPSVGIFPAVLTVTDDEGATATDEVLIDVTPPPNQDPTPSFVATPESGDAPLDISFDASASFDPDGSIVSYDWDFGDGTGGTGVTVQHTYVNGGSFVAALTVTDDGGATATSTVTVTAVGNIAPAAVATGTPLTGRAPLLVSLDGSGSTDSDGSIVSYDWDFGDGTGGTGVTVDHTYAVGTYTAVLTVVDDDGASATVDVAIEALANEAPVAAVSGSPLTGPAGLVVSLDASGSTDDSAIVSYDWDFGDGTGGSGAIIDHTYLVDGTYIATLTVTDDDAATDSASVTVVVDSNPGPDELASWPLDETAGNVAPDAVGGNDFALAGGFTWMPAATGVLDLDGTSGFGEIADGNLIGNLPAQNNGTVEDFSLSAWIKLDSANTRNPILSKQGTSESGDRRGFWFGTGEGSTAGNLYLEMYSGESAKTTISSNAELVSDGLTWHHVVATYDYITDGTSQIILYIDGQQAATTNSAVGPLQGNPQPLELGRYFWSGSYSRYFDGALDAVQIFGETIDAATVQDLYNNRPGANQLPVASFVATPESGDAPLDVSFDASASSDPDGSIVSYDWDFGDGTTGSGVTANHTYAGGGSFAVTLAVTDDGGATATSTVTVTSVGNSAPTAVATGTPLTGRAPLLVSFDGASSTDSDGSIVSYDWDFGDGTTGNGATADHTYAIGNYTAALTVTDDDGATSTVDVLIEALANTAPIADAAGSPLTGPAGLVVSLDASGSTDDSAIVSYDWDFGDGTGGSGAIIDHTYTVDGTYIATVTVTDDDAATDSSSVTVVVDSDPGPDELASWPLDETSGNVAPEAVGGNDFALVGGFGWVPGSIGVLDLDGSSGYGEIADGNLIGNLPAQNNGTVEDFSLSAWVKLDSTNTRNPILSKQGTSESGDRRGFWFGTGEGSTEGNLYLELYSGESAKTTISSNAELVSDGLTWHHVVATYDYITNGTSQITLYIDGQQAATTSSAVGPLQGNPQPLELGRYFWSNGYKRYLDGNLTAVQIFGETIDAAAVQDLYNERPLPNQDPIASFVAAPESGDAPLDVTFDASASFDPDGSIVSYDWDFGDGTTGNGVTVDHTYTPQSSFVAQLTITDDQGATATVEQTIIAFDPNTQPPTASLVATPLIGNAPLPVNFDASASTDSDGSIVSYEWDFGDGTTASGAIVDHTYVESGEYQAQLTVTDDDGRSVTVTETVKATLRELLVWDRDTPVDESDRGFPRREPPPENGDWTTPTDFASGRLHVRAEVKSGGQPVVQMNNLQLCFWQDDLALETCGSQKTVIGSPGTVRTWSHQISSMWMKNGVPLDWDRPRQRIGFAVKNSDGDPVSNFSNFNWSGENPDDWYPLDIRLTVVVVAPGETFSGWDNYID